MEPNEKIDHEAEDETRECAECGEEVEEEDALCDECELLEARGIRS